MSRVNMQAEPFTLAQVQYKAKIRSFARSNFRTIPGYEQQDLESDLLEVLWMACNTYNPNKGAKFNTYFWQLAHNKFISLHRAASRLKRVGDYDRISLDVEAVQTAVAEAFASPSAEEEVLAKLSVRELLNRRIK